MATTILSLSLSVPDENAQGREPNQRPNEPPGCRSMLNSITVSKKRNWLQQSSLGRVHGVEEPLGDLGADEEGGQAPRDQPLIRPSSSPELLMPPGVSSSRPVRFHLPQVLVIIGFLIQMWRALYWRIIFGDVFIFFFYNQQP